MKHLIQAIAAAVLMLITTAPAGAQQTAVQAQRDKASFARTIDNIDYHLMKKNEEKAHHEFNEAMDYIEAHLKTLDAKLTAAETEAQKLMFTEKISLQKKQRDELTELSKKMPENRTVINLKLKEVLESM